MSPASKVEPGQRSNANRANKVNGYTKKTLSEGDRERNRVHMSIAKEPHRWRRILYRSTLPASALRVGLALADKYLNRKGGRCDPSHETLAEECDLPVRTVRDGLSALRDLGLITTRKQGLQGTLFFYFALPCNAAEIQQVDRVSQSGENPSSNVADFRRASDGFPASNLRRTSESEPSNTVVPSSPLSVVADAPLSGSDSPPHTTRKANVEGDVQPSDFHPEEEKKEDDTAMLDFAALTYRQRSDIVRGVIGVDRGFQIPQVMDAWETAGQMSRQQLRALSLGRRSA